MPWPVRGQKGPNFWDQILKDYIDSADAANAQGVEDARTAAQAAQQTADGAEAGAAAANGAIASHAQNTNNPHNTTKFQVGLGNVDNTSDADKPVSTAVQAALNLKANLASPTFTGTPAAPTPSTSDNTTKVATTAYVKAQGYAPLASPAFTGNPTGTTQSSGDNSTRLATTAYVKSQGYAPTVSPAFTGTPLAPTQTVDDNSTRLATTAFVKAASSPLIAQGMEMREIFTNMPDGSAPLATATRQTAINYSGGMPAPAPWIRSGFLTTQTPNSAEGGSYRIVQLEGPVMRVGGRFAFSPYSSYGGLMCFSIQQTSISVGTPVPVSPMHFWISPTDWSLDVNDTAGTAVENVVSGTFPTPLASDGTTLHTVDIVLDRDRGACFVTFPNGYVLEARDPRFSLPGTFVYAEPFKPLGSPSTKTNALVKEWWADSRGIEALAEVRPKGRTIPIQPTLSASWTHTSGNPIRYWREGMKGRIKGGMAGGTMSSTMFTLPGPVGTDPGYRPVTNQHFGTVANAAFGDLLVYASGAVVPAAGSNAWVEVDITYDIKGAQIF